MATVTSSQPIRTLTPPSSSHGEPEMWEYAVPLNHDENNDPTHPKHPSSYNNATLNGTNPSKPTHSQATNGTLRASRSVEHDLLASGKTNGTRSKVSAAVNPDDPDGMLELFKPVQPQTSRSSSYSSASKAPRKASKKTSLNNMNAKTTPEQDQSYWIHRDKLAQIESKELEEAGFRVSRQPSDRRGSSAQRHEKRQRLASPARIEGEVVEDPEIYDYKEPDTPLAQEEFGTTPPRSMIPKPGSISNRQGGSRIPVPKSVSSSVSHSERDSALPGTRSRNGSSNWTTNPSDDSPKSQSGNSGSPAEANLVSSSPPETPPRTNGDTSDKISPTKRGAPRGNVSGRKSAVAARQASAARPRNTTPATKPTTETKRPGTSSGPGSNPRPSTSHRPEGDPPWLASMYKPDPRLPPDQQMLPTHAKRLAQEQWEKEGKGGTVYDKDFRLLNAEEFPPNTLSSSAAGSKRNSAILLDDSGPGSDIKSTILTTSKWRQSQGALDSPHSIQSLKRPGTSGTDHGGYKIMPTTPKGPISPGVQSPLNQPANTVRLPEGPPDNEKDAKKEKNGCCACVIM